MLDRNFAPNPEKNILPDQWMDIKIHAIFQLKPELQSLFTKELPDKMEAFTNTQLSLVEEGGALTKAFQEKYPNPNMEVPEGEVLEFCRKQIAIIDKHVALVTDYLNYLTNLLRRYDGDTDIDAVREYCISSGGVDIDSEIEQQKRMLNLLGVNRKQYEAGIGESQN